MSNQSVVSHGLFVCIDEAWFNIKPGINLQKYANPNNIQEWLHDKFCPKFDISLIFLKMFYMVIAVFKGSKK